MDGLGLVTLKFKAHSLDEVYTSNDDMGIQDCDDGFNADSKTSSISSDEGICNQENRPLSYSNISSGVPVDTPLAIPSLTSRSTSMKRTLQLVSDRANSTPNSETHCPDATETVPSSTSQLHEGSHFQTFTRYHYRSASMIFSELDQQHQCHDDETEVEDINCGSAAATKTSQVNEDSRSSTALDDEVCDLLSPRSTSMFPVRPAQLGVHKTSAKFQIVGGSDRMMSFISCPAVVPLKKRLYAPRRAPLIGCGDDQPTVIPRPSLDFEKMQRISFGRKRIHKGVKKPRVVRARIYKASTSSLHPRSVFTPSSSVSFRSLSLSLGYTGCCWTPSSSSSSVVSSSSSSSSSSEEQVSGRHAY